MFILSIEKQDTSKMFYEEHTLIFLHKASKATFDELGLKSYQRLKSLQAEYAEPSQKKQAYGIYHTAKKEMQEVLTAKANIDRLLQSDPPVKENEKAQNQR